MYWCRGLETTSSLLYFDGNALNSTNEIHSSPRWAESLENCGVQLRMVTFRCPFENGQVAIWVLSGLRKSDYDYHGPNLACSDVCSNSLTNQWEWTPCMSRRSKIDRWLLVGFGHLIGSFWHPKRSVLPVYLSTGICPLSTVLRSSQNRTDRPYTGSLRWPQRRLFFRPLGGMDRFVFVIK